MISHADAFLFVMNVDKEIAETLGEEPLAAGMVASDKPMPKSSSKPGGGSIGKLPTTGEPGVILWERAPDPPSRRAARRTEPPADRTPRSGDRYEPIEAVDDFDVYGFTARRAASKRSYELPKTASIPDPIPPRRTGEDTENTEK